MVENNVSVIIVTHNSQKYIEACISSILKNSKNIKFEIIIVDNASSDSTVKNIRKSFPQIKIIRNDSDLGFAAGVNGALKNTRGDVLLLNPDTLVGKNTITTLLRASKKRGVAAVSCKILNFDGTLQPSCGNFPSALNALFDKTPLIPTLIPLSHMIRINKFYDKKQNPDWISGSCLFISRKAVKKVGLLDESYFLYLEDVDWCFRAKQAGFQVLYTPSTVVYHADEGKSKKNSPYKFYNMRKGFIIFFKKYKKPLDLYLFKLLLRIELLLRMTFWGPKDSIWTKTYKLATKLK